MLIRGVAHSLDYDFRLVPPTVVAPLQRLEDGPRQTLATPIGGPLTEGAWERAKLPTCVGGMGIRVAQLGFAAPSTYSSAIDLHRALTPLVCAGLARPFQGERRQAFPGRAPLFCDCPTSKSGPAGCWCRCRWPRHGAVRARCAGGFV